MSKYNEDLDYLILDVDISRAEVDEIIAEADKIISDENSKKDKRIEAYLKKVQCLQKLKKLDESKKLIDKLLDLCPNMPEALARLGNVFGENKEYEKSIKCISDAINKNEKYAYAYFCRAYTYGDTKEYKRAIEDNTNAIKYKPDFVTSYNNRGWNYDKMGKYDKAIEDYKRATEINPKYDLPFNNWKNRLDTIVELKKDKKQFEDYDVESAYDKYNASFLYAAYERLHSVMDYTIKAPDFDKEVTNFLVKINDNPIRLAEYYLLMFLVEYLHSQAPSDEQNLFMVVELIAAGKKEGDYDSDLDRLFNMLKEKDEKHIAVRHYEKFKIAAGGTINDIIYSCRKHFSIIGTSGNFFKYINNKNDIMVLTRIIMKSFFVKGTDSNCSIDELYNYLNTLYEDSKSNGKLVAIDNIDGKKYGINEL